MYTNRKYRHTSTTTSYMNIITENSVAAKTKCGSSAIRNYLNCRLPEMLLMSLQQQFVEGQQKTRGYSPPKAKYGPFYACLSPRQIYAIEIPTSLLQSIVLNADIISLALSDQREWQWLTLFVRTCILHPAHEHVVATFIGCRKQLLLRLQESTIILGQNCSWKPSQSLQLSKKEPPDPPNLKQFAGLNLNYIFLLLEHVSQFAQTHFPLYSSNVKFQLKMQRTEPLLSGHTVSRFIQMCSMTIRYSVHDVV